MYRGRFAPSPTGELHAGSLVAALASYLDARAHHGEWLVRMEDVDAPRCIEGADKMILKQLQQCGLHWNGDVVYQSLRDSLYQQALDDLLAQDLVYPCGCTRKEIEENQALLGLDLSRNKAAVYPGTCREGLQGKPARAWRFNVRKWSELRASPVVHWTDRRLGPQSQNVLAEVGDFVLKRADGLWAYQLAVVVDDAKQGITHVVRGEDLSDNTARQMLLQEALGMPVQVTFQSRFGRAEWLKPYTDDTLLALPNDGVKKIAVVCPGFAADCLETLEEIAMEGKETFLTAGGKEFHYVPCLNDRADWVAALHALTVEHLAGWPIDRDLQKIAEVAALARAHGAPAAALVQKVGLSSVTRRRWPRSMMSFTIIRPFGCGCRRHRFARRRCAYR
jgi:glutamyl-Q tRNA(Asp) synthetase